jgi:hypothetical protein
MGAILGPYGINLGISFPHGGNARNWLIYDDGLLLRKCFGTWRRRRLSVEPRGWMENIWPTTNVSEEIRSAEKSS